METEVIMKKLLIVVDYQTDFVSGILGSPAAAEIEDIICGKIEQYRAENAEIVFTMDTHGDDYAEMDEGRKLPMHCQKDSGGWQLYGKVKTLKKDSDKYFCKSTFGSGELYDYLCRNSYDAVELCGVVTDICVISNAVLVRTALPCCEITVDAKAVAGGKCGLDTMKSMLMNIVNYEG